MYLDSLISKALSVRQLYSQLLTECGEFIVLLCRILHVCLQL